jgi:hypothetical protein
MMILIVYTTSFQMRYDLFSDSYYCGHSGHFRSLLSVNHSKMVILKNRYFQWLYLVKRHWLISCLFKYHDNCGFCNELTVQMQLLTSFSILNGPSRIKNICHVVFQSFHSILSIFKMKDFSILSSFDIDISGISL